MAASRPARSGRHGSNLVCALPSPKSGRPVRTESHRPARRVPDPAGVRPSDPTRQADQADELMALERRFIAELGEELAPFIRERLKAGQPQDEVVNSLRRTAPAALLLGSLAHVSAAVEAAIAVAELAIADDPRPAKPPRRRRPAKS